MQASSSCRAGGKVAVIVTGASRGFGQALSQELARRLAEAGVGGIDFLLVARTEAGLAQTEEAIRKAVPSNFEVKVARLPLDLADLDRVPEAFAAGLAQLGGEYERVVLANNHGSLDMAKIRGSASAEGVKTTRRAIDMNVTSTLIITPLVLERFSPKTPLTVVNTSSLLALVPSLEFGRYCSGKAARDIYHSVLALEEKDNGVRTLNYAPGRMNTVMAADILANTSNELSRTSSGRNRRTAPSSIPPPRPGNSPT